MPVRLRKRREKKLIFAYPVSLAILSTEKLLLISRCFAVFIRQVGRYSLIVVPSTSRKIVYDWVQLIRNCEAIFPAINESDRNT
jgi:hypothetical protein